MGIIENTTERISAVDAKSNLPKLLHKVETGSRTFVITRRGKPVACLVPYTDPGNPPSRKEILKQFDEIRNNVRGDVDIKAYIAEGRNR